MKKYILFVLLAFSATGFSQSKNINNYKYVIIPEKFAFMKEQNQYGLNSLSKAFLERKGFTVFYDDTELPLELVTNKCNALIVDVTENNSMFNTILTVLLKDCKGNILFTSAEGKSREKAYKTAYNLALREAFKSVDALPYKYQELSGAEVTTVTANSHYIPATANTVTTVSSNSSGANEAIATGTLYAQATATGYQLVDTTPKKVLTLFKTSQQDYYTANNGKNQGMVFKKEGQWYFEYYQNDKLISEKLDIKF